MGRQEFPSTGERTVFQRYDGGALAKGRGVKDSGRTATTAIELALVLTALLIVTFGAL